MENVDIIPGAAEDEDESNKPAMMSNDDSFTNIAPANDNAKEEQDNKSSKMKKESSQKKKEEHKGESRSATEKEETKGKDLPNKVSVSKKQYDIDEIVAKIVEKENFEPGKMQYDPKALHKMNPDFLDEYIDEDDPGFDTYVVNEENFVASCQELARINDFPTRAILPDTKHDMAFRERHRKKIEAAKEKNRQTKS